VALSLGIERLPCAFMPLAELACSWVRYRDLNVRQD
jgi:hypothetical protein